MSDGAPGRPLRVLHCPALVGGHAQELARAERALGLDSHTVALDPPPFGYGADTVLFPPGTGLLQREGRRWRFVRATLRTFDVVHFNFGSTLMPRWHPDTAIGAAAPARWAYSAYARLFEERDLVWLKRRGIAVFVTYQGDDARQWRPRFAALGDDYFDRRLERRKQASIARFAQYADGIYALNPDLLDVLPERAEFLPYASVDLTRWRPVERRPEGPPVLVHAPSERRAKGTELLLEAVDRLRADGVMVELVLVEAMARSEARRALERADLVVDQLVVGWYGGVAVEAMALGKPVVAYIDDGDLARVPAAMRDELPILRASGTTVEAVLREYATVRRKELPDVGKRGRAYVERWHDPVAVAARLKAAYERSVRS